MKKIIICLGLLTLIGCGYSSTENEVVGQIKKVVHNTPLICPNYFDIDLTLGVMKNGTGSMSTQDQWYYVEDKSLIKKLKEANETGAIVKVKYDVKRFAFCVSNHFLTDVEVVE